MDMKKILQALDGVSAKPAVGVDDMKKFVSIIKESTSPKSVEETVISSFEAGSVGGDANEYLLAADKINDEVMAQVERIKINADESLLRDMMTKFNAFMTSYHAVGKDILQPDMFKDSLGEQGVAEGSAHGFNVVKWYKKSGGAQLKLTKWLRKEAGLPKDAPVYFDDADLVYGEKTIVPDALINPNLKFNDLLTAVAQAGGGRAKEKVQGVYRDQSVAEGEKTMSRAAKGNEKYGKDGMKALAKAGREGASEEKLDKIRDKHDNYNEGLSFTDYLNLEEAKQKGVDGKACWDGYKRMGTKKKGGKTVDNCVPTGKK